MWAAVGVVRLCEEETLRADMLLGGITYTKCMQAHNWHRRGTVYGFVFLCKTGSFGPVRV